MGRSKDPTDEEIQTLPRRYSDYIVSLRRRVVELEKEKAQQTNTRVIVDPSGARKFLPNDSVVRFYVGGRPLVDAEWFEAFTDGRVFQVRSLSPMCIHPEVSNGIRIEVRKFL